MIFVHSPLLQASCWDELVATLASRGVGATTVEYPISPTTSIWSPQADAISAAVEEHRADQVVFHSGAGTLAGAVVDRIERDIELVLIDAMVPSATMSRLDHIAEEQDPVNLQIEAALESSGSYPHWGPRTWAKLLDNDEQVERLAPTLQPHGSDYWNEVATCTTRWTRCVTRYVVCSDPYRHYAETARSMGATVVEVMAGHLAMVRVPDLIADALLLDELSKRA